MNPVGALSAVPGTNAPDGTPDSSGKGGGVPSTADTLAGCRRITLHATVTAASTSADDNKNGAPGTLIPRRPIHPAAANAANVVV